MSGTRTFAGKSVVITGAARGIGAALARRFASERAKLALLDLDSEAVAKQAAEIAATGAQAFGARCDVTSLDDCRAAMRSVLDAYGAIDVLVNNAGITHLSRFRGARAAARPARSDRRDLERRGLRPTRQANRLLREQVRAARVLRVAAQ
jgi:NAD(P)-dependent dehydrogenase (short-subunit alcohol dehydrogenase family)